jgi:sorbitol-specific phosphotransferase system component IIBC
LTLNLLLRVIAFVCFVIALICVSGSNDVIGLGALGWTDAGLGLWILSTLFGDVRLGGGV